MKLFIKFFKNFENVFLYLSIVLGIGVIFILINLSNSSYLSTTSETTSSPVENTEEVAQEPENFPESSNRFGNLEVSKIPRIGYLTSSPITTKVKLPLSLLVSYFEMVQQDIDTAIESITYFDPTTQTNLEINSEKKLMIDYFADNIKNFLYDNHSPDFRKYKNDNIFFQKIIINLKNVGEEKVFNDVDSLKLFLYSYENLEYDTIKSFQVFYNFENIREITFSLNWKLVEDKFKPYKFKIYLPNKDRTLLTYEQENMNLLLIYEQIDNYYNDIISEKYAEWRLKMTDLCVFLYYYLNLEDDNIVIPAELSPLKNLAPIYSNFSWNKIIPKHKMFNFVPWENIHQLVNFTEWEFLENFVDNLENNFFTPGTIWNEVTESYEPLDIVKKEKINNFVDDQARFLNQFDPVYWNSRSENIQLFETVVLLEFERTKTFDDLENFKNFLYFLDLDSLEKIVYKYKFPNSSRIEFIIEQYPREEEFRIFLFAIKIAASVFEDEKTITYKSLSITKQKIYEKIEQYYEYKFFTQIPWFEKRLELVYIYLALVAEEFYEDYVPWFITWVKYSCFWYPFSHPPLELPENLVNPNIFGIKRKIFASLRTPNIWRFFFRLSWEKLEYFLVYDWDALLRELNKDSCQRISLTEKPDYFEGGEDSTKNTNPPQSEDDWPYPWILKKISPEYMNIISAFMDEVQNFFVSYEPIEELNYENKNIVFEKVKFIFKNVDHQSVFSLNSLLEAVFNLRFEEIEKVIIIYTFNDIKKKELKLSWQKNPDNTFTLIEFSLWDKNTFTKQTIADESLTKETVYQFLKEKEREIITDNYEQLKRNIQILSDYPIDENNPQVIDFLSPDITTIIELQSIINSFDGDITVSENLFQLFNLNQIKFLLNFFPEVLEEKIMNFFALTDLPTSEEESDLISNTEPAPIDESTSNVKMVCREPDSSPFRTCNPEWDNDW